MKSFPTQRGCDPEAKEIVEDWRGLSFHVPFITLDPGWTIAIIPPFAGTASRFLVKNSLGAKVSVYLDTSQALGCSDDIYWEVYPVNDNNQRCSMEDGEELLRLIREGLTSQGNKDQAT